MTSAIKMPITRSAAADLLDVPSSELRGVFANRKSLPLDEFVTSYLENLSAAPEEVGEMKGESEEQNRELLIASAACRELRAELIDGESYRQSDVEDVVSFRLAGAVARFNHLGAKLAMQILNQSSADVVRIVENAISEAKEDLIDFNGRDFACEKLFFEPDSDDNGNGDHA
jgi:hypothetical protein